MKRTLGGIRQLISVLLVAAMVITCVPQTGFPVLADGKEQFNEVITEDGPDDTGALQDDGETGRKESGGDIRTEGGGDTSGEDTDAGNETAPDAGDVTVDDIQSDGSGDTGASDVPQPDEGEDEVPISYVVTVIGTGRAEVEFEKTVQAAQAYDFTVEAREGYTVEDVRVYRTSEYEEHENDLDGTAVIGTETAETETEGRIRYIIAENVIDADLTIVVSTTALEDGAGYTLAAFDETVSYNVALAAESAQAVVAYEESVRAGQEYSFTVKAKETYVIKDVKVYKTSDYSVNKADLSAATPITATQGNTSTEGEKKYTIAADDIDADITIVVMAEENDTDQCTVMVEYPRSGEARIGKMTYAVGDSTRFISVTSKGITVRKGEKVRIKAAGITAGYVVYVDKGEEGKEYLGSDNIYTIGSAENTTVSFQMESKKFAVSCEVLGKNDDEQVTVTIPGSTVGDLSGEVEANAALRVSARVVLSDSNSRRVGGATYQIGEGQPVSVQLTDNQKMGKSVISISIPRDVITGDVKIKVMFEDIPKYKVTFDYDSERVQIQFASSGLNLESDNSIEVLDGSRDARSLQFKPVFTEAGKMFKVVQVTANGTVLKPGEETGRYLLKNITEAVNVEVTIRLDETKCNSLTIAADGHQDAFTASVTGLMDGDDDYGKENVTYEAGDKVLTQADQLTAVIKLSDGYQIDKVEAEGKELSPESVNAEKKESTFLVPLRGVNEQYGRKTLTVYTAPEPAKVDKTVQFSRAADNQSAKVDVNETDKIKKTESEDLYTIEQGATYFDFAVTMEGSEYDPVLRYADADNSGQEGTDIFFRGKEGNTYYYSLAATNLPENTVIQMYRKEVTQTVQVNYDRTEVKVSSAKIGITPIEGTPVEKKGISYTVPRGHTISIRVDAEENCQIVSAQTTMDGSTRTEKTEISGFTFFVTADADSVTEIESTGLLSVRPLEEVGGGVMTPVSGVYHVSCYKSYRGGVMEGTGPFFHDRVEVKVNGKTVDQGSEESQGVEVRDESTSFVLGLSEEAATKTIEVNLYTIEGEDDEEAGTRAKEIKVASYKLQVSAVLADKDVSINGGNEIMQSIDTVVGSYKIAVTKNTDVNDLGFEIPAGDDNKDVVRAAEIVNGMLQITTGFGAGESTELKVYTEADGTKRYIQKDDKDLTVKVTAAPLLENTKYQPTVKQASSTDVSITLSLGAKGVPAHKDGKVYYEVKLTPNLATVAAEDKGKLLETVPVQYVLKTGDAQEAMIYVGANGSVANPAYGGGTACQYGVDVRLVHSDVEAINGNIAPANIKGGSKPFHKDAGKDFATKNPTYETNLKLKKAASVIYTTQQNVVIATPVFSKETTYTVLPDGGVEDTTAGLGDGQQLTFTIEGNQVKASATKDTALGKHTIQVTAATTGTDADGVPTMYASRATIVITVARGIEDIKLNIPTDSIYYPNKAVTLKTTVDYNITRKDSNPKDSAPKAKKVEYRLVDTSVERDSLADLKALNDVVEAAVVKDGVKIDKNGKISVPKNYKVTADSSFKVLVKAADFGDNEVFDLSDPITITRDYMQIGKALLLREENGSYQVIDVDNNEVDASVLNGAQMMAFTEGLAAKKSYTEAELEKYRLTKNLTYVSANKKTLDIDSNGIIRVNAPAKKVKLTVAPADGSSADRKLNTTRTITVTVKYDTTGELGLQIDKINIVKEDNTPTRTFAVEEVEKDKGITYNDSSAAVFALNLKHKTGETWNDVPYFTDYKLTVTKGKVLSTSKKEGIQTIITANDKLTTVKLTYKVYDQASKKYVSRTKEYKLTNAGLAETTVKAPKIAFRDRRDTIQANYNICDKTLERNQEGAPVGRYIGFNLTPNGQKYPLDFESGKDQDGNDLYVKVDVDWSVMTPKNEKVLEELADSMNPKGCFKLNSRGNYGGYVHLAFANDAVLTPGSYKLKVCIGTVNDDREFILAAQPAAMTIKVAKDKALSFKPVTSYKISAKDNGYAVLTGKGSYDTVTFSALQNDNVRGRLKGRPNAFKTYFALGTDGKGNQILKLTDNCFENGALKEIPKEDLTGYVSYEVSYKYEKNAPRLKGIVKISVKLEEKPIAKYAITNATTFKEAGAVANVTVSANKQPISVAYAVVKGVDHGKWQVVSKDSAGEWTTTAQTAGSVISLQHTDAMENKSAKVTLLVIPGDSYYRTKIEAETDDAKKRAIIGKYGVELKTTITLSGQEAATKRIAVDKADTTQKFMTKWQESASGVQSGYDATNENYCINVPYTELYGNASAGIKGIKTIVGNQYTDLINFDKADGKNAISISMNKRRFMEKVDEKERDFYTIKDPDYYDTYVPKTINVTARVCYGGTAAEPTAPSDDITFKLTLPEYPKFRSSYGYKTDYEQAFEYIEELEEKISDFIAGNMQKYDYYYMQKLESDELDKSIKKDVKQHLEDRIRFYVGDDSGIDMRDLQGRMTIGTTAADYTAPTDIMPGVVKIRVKFTNGMEGDLRQENSVVFFINLPPFGAKADSVKPQVEAFLNQVVITNRTTRESLLTDLKSYVEKDAVYDADQIKYTFTTFDMVPATLENPGSLSLVVEIRNVADGGNPALVERTGDRALAIRALLSEEEAIEAVSEAVGASGSNAANVIKRLAKTNEPGYAYYDVLEAAEKAVEGNPYIVTYAKKTTGDPTMNDFNFVSAKRTAEGSISFKLIVKREDDTFLDPDNPSKGIVSVGETKLAAIPDLLTRDQAGDKVNEWLEANTLQAGEDASDASLSKVLKNGVTAEDILNAITVPGCVPPTSLISVRVENIKCKDATDSEAGRITGKIYLRDQTRACTEMTMDRVIPALPRT